jgi:hypothetical protein
MDFTCLLIFTVLSYLKLVLLNEAETGKYLKCFPVKHSFKLILRNVCLYTQSNVYMTKHIMQTRSTQSILKQAFGFNCFKFSLIILKPVNY